MPGTELRLAPEEVVLRLVVATVIGALVGLERQRRNHPAGLRTHTLVCLGSALVMLMSEDIAARYMDRTNADPGRIAAQVVSGIGFLGAGTIMREGLTVRGLTTAASLWVVASLGLAVGGGYYLPALTATILSLMTLSFLNRLEHAFMEKYQEGRLHLQVEDSPGRFAAALAELQRLRVSTRAFQVEQVDDGAAALDMELTVNLPRGLRWEELVQNLLNVPGVISIEYDVAC